MNLELLFLGGPFLRGTKVTLNFWFRVQGLGFRNLREFWDVYWGPPIQGNYLVESMEMNGNCAWLSAKLSGNSTPYFILLNDTVAS